MKRSKMVKVVIDAVYYNDPMDSILTEDEASKVLAELEAKGMLPPEHLFTSGERKDHYLNEWEPEDETK